jgi:amino-acid N-acetyltransferase
MCKTQSPAARDRSALHRSGALDNPMLSNPLNPQAPLGTGQAPRTRPAPQLLRSDSVAALVVRKAVPLDQTRITRLVHSERLNPHGLEWRNFVVATIDNTVVGAVQMRHHADGARELGSLVVDRAHRGQGIAGRMITALLEQHAGTVHVITRREKARHYVRWGFRALALRHAPRSVWRACCLGQLASVLSILSGRQPRRLVILRLA